MTVEAPSGYSILGNAETSLTVQAGQITTASSFTLAAENTGEGGDTLHLPTVQKP